MNLTIIPASAADPAVIALLEAHAQHCIDASPPESRHYIPASARDTPEITLWAARHEREIVGVGALKALSDSSGEIKSMHTCATRRGLGIARALLAEIEDAARRRGYVSLWLETGTMAEFVAARVLYERHGFAPCPPFGAYTPDRNSICYTKSLTRAEAPA